MSSRYPELETYVAIDCEMIRLRTRNVLAKIGIVDYQGNVVLESFVHSHPGGVVDYVTRKSGVTAELLVGAPTFEQLQPRIIAALQDKIIVGHTLFNDLAVIKYKVKYERMRDTALFYPLRRVAGVKGEGNMPSLKLLARKVLGDEEFQREGKAHDPVEDARITMRIFLKVRDLYEEGIWKGKDVVACLPSHYVDWYW